VSEIKAWQVSEIGAWQGVGDKSMAFSVGHERVVTLYESLVKVEEDNCVMLSRQRFGAVDAVPNVFSADDFAL